jgi:cell division protein FtsL
MTWSLGTAGLAVAVKTPGGLALPWQRRLFLGTLATVLALLALALLHVWLRVEVVRTGYHLSASAKLQRELEQENRELKVELASLTSPKRLEEMARQRLNLKEAARGQIVILP